MKNQSDYQSKNIKIGIVISYLSFIVSCVYSFFYSRFLIQNLGSEQFGLNSFASSITSWFSLLTLGLSSTYIRFATRAEKQEQEHGVQKINAFYTVFLSIVSAASAIIGSIIAILIFVSAIPLNNYSPSEKTILISLLLISTARSAASFLFSFFSLYEAFRFRFIWLRSVDMFTTIFSLLATFIAVWLGGNIVAVAVSGLACQVISGLVSGLYCFSKLKLRLDFVKGQELSKMIKEILVFSVFVFINVIVDQINTYLGRIVLGFEVQVDPAKAVTSYTLGGDFFAYAGVLSGAMGGNFAPTVNKLVVDGKVDDVNRLFLKVSFLQMIVMFLCVGGFVSCGRQFVFAWLGPGQENVFYVADILLFAGLVPYTESLGIEIQRAYNKHMFRSYFYLGMALINVVLTILLVHFVPGEYQVISAAIGTAVALILGNWIGMNWYYKTKMGMPIKAYFLKFLIFFLVTAFSCAFVYLVFDLLIDISSWNKWLVFVARGGLFAVIYIIILGLIFWKKIKVLIEDKKKISQENHGK